VSSCFVRLCYRFGPFGSSGLTIGEPGDPETDPTILWPKDRRELKVGTLTILSAMPQKDAGSYKINYDPLIMGDGIAVLTSRDTEQGERTAASQLLHCSCNPNPGCGHASVASLPDPFPVA
jgi:hypothetical protein